jgi:hypothetical protein
MALPQGGFLSNQGQWDEVILHAGAWGGARVVVLEDGLLVDLPVDSGRRAVKLHFLGVPELGDAAETRVNLYRGADPARWAEGLLLHRALVCDEIEFRFVPEGLSYRFAEGITPTTLRFEGGELIDRRDATGRAGVLLWPDSPSIALPLRDPSDQLLWSTLFGGNSSDAVDELREVAGGDLILYGGSYSSNLPTAPGVYDEIHNGSSDLYFARLAPTGDTVVWCTYVGGSDRDHSDGFAATGDAIYFTSTVMSDDLPVPGALDPTYGGSFDIYLGKLSLDGGTLHWASYLGGAGNDQTNAIIADAQGRVVVTGFSDTPDYPTTPGAAQELPVGGNEIVVTALEEDGSAIAWSTFLGGDQDENCMALVLAADGALLLNGWTKSADFPVTPGAYDTQITTGYYQNDTVVIKLAGDGGSIIWASYLGGSTDSMERGYGVGEDAQGNVIVSGSTKSEDFPTTPGAFDTVHGGSGERDAYVAKFNATGSELIWSTFVGGSEAEGSSEMIVTPEGWVVIAGYTFSSDYPVTPGAYDETLNSPPHEGADIGVALLSGGGDEMLWASYLGGNTDDRGYALGLTSDGGLIIGGQTASSNFPTTPGAYMEELSTPSQHGFVTKFMMAALVTAAEEAPPARMPTLSAYPNPFNPAVTIDFELPAAGPLSLRVYDLGGREVATLFEGVHPGGRGEIVWRPEGLASGLYLARLETSRGAAGERLVLLK